MTPSLALSRAQGMSALPNAAKFVFPAQPYNFLRRHMTASCSAGGGGLSEAGLALLNGLLTYDPARRITARQALRHEWFQVGGGLAAEGGREVGGGGGGGGWGGFYQAQARMGWVGWVGSRPEVP